VEGPEQIKVRLAIITINRFAENAIFSINNY